MRVKHKALELEAALWDGQTAGDWTSVGAMVPNTWPAWLPGARLAKVADDLKTLGIGESMVWGKYLYLGQTAPHDPGSVVAFKVDPGMFIIQNVDGRLAPMSQGLFSQIYTTAE